LSGVLSGRRVRDPGWHEPRHANARPRDGADLTGDIKSAIRGGGFGGGSRTTNNSTYNIHALDAQSFADMLRRNPSILAAAVAQHQRSGGRMYTG
jgi:hypothetical protein